MRRKCWVWGLVAILAVLLVSGCGTSPKTPADKTDPKSNSDKTSGSQKVDNPLTVAEIALLSGPDREQKLIEGAKKEGELVWYTALIVNQAVEPMVKAFQEKYPFIKVSYSRGNSGETIQKVVTAYQAQKYDVDVIDGSGPPAAIKAEGYTVPFTSPSLDKYPDNLKDADKKWAATNLYYMAMGYNTQLVPADKVPKTYEDLLKPEWKGKMAWGTGEGAGSAATFLGNILTSMGEEKGMEYVKKLSDQQVHNVASSARAVLDQVIAGQYSMALQIFNYHAEISASQGAPVGWVPLEPTPGIQNDIALLKNAPHPYSAMLFIDFILGKEGQTVLQKAGYIPANPEITPKWPSVAPAAGNFKANVMNPENVQKEQEKWQKIYKELFLNKAY